MPEPYIVQGTAKILDLQNPDKQMSKSIGGPGVLWLLDEPAVNAKKIRAAVTDTEREVRFDPEDKPGVSNLLTIMSALSGESVEALEKRFDGSGYGDLKAAVADAFVAFATPFRERAHGLPRRPGPARRRARDRCRQGGRDRRSRRSPLAYDRVGFLPAR